MINNLDSIILGIKDGEKAIEDLRVVLKKEKKKLLLHRHLITLYNAHKLQRKR